MNLKIKTQQTKKPNYWQFISFVLILIILGMLVYMLFQYRIAEKNKAQLGNFSIDKKYLEDIKKIMIPNQNYILCDMKGNKCIGIKIK